MKAFSDKDPDEIAKYMIDSELRALERLTRTLRLAGFDQDKLQVQRCDVPPPDFGYFRVYDSAGKAAARVQWIRAPRDGSRELELHILLRPDLVAAFAKAEFAK